MFKKIATYLLILYVVINIFAIVWIGVDYAHYINDIKSAKNLVIVYANDGVRKQIDKVCSSYKLLRKSVLITECEVPNNVSYTNIFLDNSSKMLFLMENGQMVKISSSYDTIVLPDIVHIEVVFIQDAIKWIHIDLFILMGLIMLYVVALIDNAVKNKN